MPPIPGLDGVDYLTYEQLWDLEQFPGRMVVLGGGPIGCEMVQAFGRLGVQVTVVEAGPRLLPRDDPEASSLVAEVFRREGIDTHLDSKADRSWQDTDGIHLGPLIGSQHCMGGLRCESQSKNHTAQREFLWFLFNSSGWR